MLRPEYTSQFERDVKRLKKKHVSLEALKEVMLLVLEDSKESQEELSRRHNAHVLKGDWSGSNECHVANAGDWLLVWKTGKGLAVFQRTGTHDELFR